MTNRRLARVYMPRRMSWLHLNGGSVYDISLPERMRNGMRKDTRNEALTNVKSQRIHKCCCALCCSQPPADRNASARSSYPSSSSSRSPHFLFFFRWRSAFAWPWMLLRLRASVAAYGSPVSTTMSAWTDARDILPTDGHLRWPPSCTNSSHRPNAAREPGLSCPKAVFTPQNCLTPANIRLARELRCKGRCDMVRVGFAPRASPRATPSATASTKRFCCVCESCSQQPVVYVYICNRDLNTATVRLPRGRPGHGLPDALLGISRSLLDRGCALCAHRRSPR
jgi:hypothetical protein